MFIQESLRTHQGGLSWSTWSELARVDFNGTSGAVWTTNIHATNQTIRIGITLYQQNNGGEIKKKRLFNGDLFDTVMVMYSWVIGHYCNVSATVLRLVTFGNVW